MNPTIRPRVLTDLISFFRENLDSSGWVSPHRPPVHLKLPIWSIAWIHLACLWAALTTILLVNSMRPMGMRKEIAKVAGNMNHEVGISWDRRWLSVPPEGDAKRDDQWQNPAEQQRNGHMSGRHLSRVMQWITHSYVSVQCHAAEIKNGMCKRWHQAICEFSRGRRSSFQVSD